MTDQLTVLKEVVYDYQALPIIMERFPNAKVTDASDFMHDSRFELEIENCTKDEFYPFAIKEGFALLCLGFPIFMQKDKETLKECKRWLEMSETS